MSNQKTNKTIHFQNGSLDCYSKSEDDFIAFLREDLKEKLNRCRENISFEKHWDALNNIERNIWNDDFIKNYFNDNLDENILNEKKETIKEIIKSIVDNAWDRLIYNTNLVLFNNLGKDFVIKNNELNLLFKTDFLSKKNTIINREAIIKNWSNSLTVDFVIEIDGISIFWEVKSNSRNNTVFIWLYLCKWKLNSDSYSDLDLDLNFRFFLEILTKRSKGDDSDVLWENCYILELKDIHENIVVGKGYQNMRWFQPENYVIENILDILNIEISNSIIKDAKFSEYIKAFIPKE